LGTRTLRDALLRRYVFLAGTSGTATGAFCCVSGLPADTALLQRFMAALTCLVMLISSSCYSMKLAVQTEFTKQLKFTGLPPSIQNPHTH
jgi:hypothetical protein